VDSYRHGPRPGPDLRTKSEMTIAAGSVWEYRSSDSRLRIPAGLLEPTAGCAVMVCSIGAGAARRGGNPMKSLVLILFSCLTMVACSSAPSTTEGVGTSSAALTSATVVAGDCNSCTGDCVCTGNCNSCTQNCNCGKNANSCTAYCTAGQNANSCTANCTACENANSCTANCTAGHNANACKSGCSVDNANVCGAIMEVCAPGTTRCDPSSNGVDTCTSTGSWGTAAACINQACVGGACTGVCAPGATQCSGDSAETCGSTGAWGSAVACTTSVANAGATCTSGACGFVCNSGYTDCNGACVDEQTDLNNCGACGTVCSTAIADATAACVSSACTFTCNSGYTLCNGACVDELTDPNNCSACGASCPTGDTCSTTTQTCVPTTCAALGYNCGPAGDGCGGQLDCGDTCPANEGCGGGGTPGVCGPVPPCTNLCQQQRACPGSNITTTVSGTVYAPNGTDPLNNVLVYVPNGTVEPIGANVSCGQCGSDVSGSPLVSTMTAVDGTFSLSNVPVGTNIPLVMQSGRWRRVISIPSVASCTNTALTAAQTSMPSSEGMGNPMDNIPLMGFVTGTVDALECVLLKIGIAQSQFSDPAAQGGSGRVRFYLGEGGPGSKYSPSTPVETQLWSGTTPDINQYDMVYFPCQAGEYPKTAAEQQVIVNYANAGGRIFATHYSYVWFINPTSGATNPFATTAVWDVDQADPPLTTTGFINQSFTDGANLATWLGDVGATTTPGEIELSELRHDFNSVVAPSMLWASIESATVPPGLPTMYSFQTPVGTPAAQQCGRTVFNDFHVEEPSSGSTEGTTFPAECPAGTTTPQEKLLEYMLFDLSSCVVVPPPPTPNCTSTTCAAQGFNCGPAGDGCGNLLNCGSCSAPDTCGGGGQPGICGNPYCAP